MNNLSIDLRMMVTGGVGQKPSKQKLFREYVDNANSLLINVAMVERGGHVRTKLVPRVTQKNRA